MSKLSLKSAPLPRSSCSLVSSNTICDTCSTPTPEYPLRVSSTRQEDAPVLVAAWGVGRRHFDVVRQLEELLRP